MKRWAKNVARLTKTRLRQYLQDVSSNVDIIASTNDNIVNFILAAIRSDQKLNCHLWIKRLVDAINDNVSMAKRPDQLETFVNLRESSFK